MSERRFGQSDVERLLEQLCVELGFCLPAEERARLATQPPDDDAEFARELFVAEGLEPDHADKALFRAVSEQIAAARRRAQGDSR